MSTGGWTWMDMVSSVYLLLLLQHLFVQHVQHGSMAWHGMAAGMAWHGGAVQSILLVLPSFLLLLLFFFSIFYLLYHATLNLLSLFIYIEPFIFSVHLLLQWIVWSTLWSTVRSSCWLSFIRALPAAATTATRPCCCLPRARHAHVIFYLACPAHLLPFIFLPYHIYSLPLPPSHIHLLNSSSFENPFYNK